MLYKQEETGTRQRQKFAIGGGLNGNQADHLTTPLNVLDLANCYVDKRLGVAIKRGGSVTEAAGTGLGVPTGIGAWETKSPGSSIPLSVSLLVNFSGTFKSRTGTAWNAVSTSSSVNFATSSPSQFAMLGQRLYIAGGRPAFWGGPNTTIERIGIPAPTTAPPADGLNVPATAATNPIDSRSGVVGYIYTFYNSATGLESDWSPVWTTGGPPINAGGTYPYIDVTMPVPSSIPAGVTHKRLYRSYPGGSTYYLVAEIPIGTLVYRDSKRDSQLTTAAARRGTRGLPPQNSFIIAAYAQRLWMVDSADPRKLVRSDPYIGSDTDCEYFREDAYAYFTQPITGLLVIPGRLLVFHPRGISYIAGTSDADFQPQTFRQGVGTLFPNSIATNGRNIICLAEQGWVDITSEALHISREIDHELQPLLAGSYNSRIYVAAVWNPSIRQFVCMINAVRTANPQWQTVGTGATAQWRVVGTGQPAQWSQVGGGSGSASNRVKFWGWTPELSSAKEQRNMWQKYTFPVISDLNSSGAYPTVMYHPQPSSELLDPQQDKTFICYYDGTEGKVRSTFRKDTALDDEAAITATILTGRVQPGRDDGGYKRFLCLQLLGEYGDITDDGNATIKYLIDFEDPHLRNFSASLKTIATTDKDQKPFPNGLARFIHLYITDTSTTINKPLLADFYIHFRERRRRTNG